MKTHKKVLEEGEDFLVEQPDHRVAEANAGTVRSARTTIEKSEQLLERALDAKAAMNVMVDKWRISWLTFYGETGTRLNELQRWRIAMCNEMDKLMTACKDVRTFFLDPMHAVEVERLEKFVALCERLQKLKQSGFLDAMADTILKMACQKDSSNRD